MSRFQDLTDLFKRLLRTATREDLIGHFETTISGYEKEIDRQQKLLDVVLKPEIKLQSAVFPADVQQLLVSKEEVPPEQQEWSPLLDREESKPPHIKEEEEELWSGQEGEQLQWLEEADITKVSRLQDLTDLFKRRLLTAAREDLIGYFETTISGYEKEIDRQQKLLDVVLKPEIKLRRADVQQLLVSKEEVPPEQQEWSPLLDQEEPPEPPHIKEEEEELWSSQEGEQLQGPEEADITKFTSTSVPVKGEEDDEEKPQSSQLHQRQTEAGGEDCGGPESARNSDPERHLQPDTDDKTEDSSETETDDRDKDWKDPERKTFCCSVCGKNFNHKGNLNIHMRTHTGVKPFSCSLCSKRFTQKAGLDYHLKTHTGERPFSCSVCGKTYRHKGALTYHMVTHTGVKPFSCSCCDKRFRGRSQLKIHKCVGDSSQLHRSLSDKRKKPLSCSECDATFPNNYLLTTHIRMHKGKKLFTCTVCSKKLQFSSHLEIHMRTHTGEKPYSCSVCGKRFSQKGIMKQHMAIHSEVKPFSCSHCGRRFFWHFQIKKHKCLGVPTWQRLTGFHGKNPGGSEPVRGFTLCRHLKPDTEKDTRLSFETDASVDIDFWKETRQHQSGFTYRRNKKNSANDGCDATEKRSVCPDDTAKTEPNIDNSVRVDFCKLSRHRPSGVNHLKKQDIFVNDSGYNTDSKPSSFSVRHIGSENTLQTHNTRPTVKKLFRCLFCGKGFATGGYLTRHISLHIGEKLLCCTICEETFTLESELISHRCGGESSQLHHSQTVEQITANKLFSCSQCGKGFGRKHLLQVHMRVHAGEKPFSCSVCGKTFGRQEGLHFHMSCHTGDKPFHCSVCDSGFIDSESLVKHMRIHTRQTQFSCSVCGKEFAWRRYLTKHMEVHAKEKIFRCRVCEGGFTQMYQLRNHQCFGESSQLCESPTEENREVQLLTSRSAEQMETEADGEDCEGPEPDRNSDPERRLQHVTDDSADSDFWQEPREPQSGFNPQEHPKVFQSKTTCNTGRKHFSCSENDEMFSNNHLLKIHQRNHTDREKPLQCSTCENPCKESLSQHMEVDTGVHRGAKTDPEPPHIKEEEEELWSSQEGEQLQGLEEADITKVTSTPVPVKGEEDDEEKPQSSQLHQRQTEADEDCGGPEPARNSDPERHLQPDTDDSVDSDFWKETRERTTGFNSVKTDEISEGFMGFDSGNKVLNCSDDKAPESLEPDSDDSDDSDFWKDNRKPQQTRRNLYSCRKPYSCSECSKRFFHIHHLKSHMKFHLRERAPFFCSVCGQGFLYKSHLKIHTRTHTGEKPFPCPVCGKKYAHKASMQSHMVVHTVEKQYACSDCHKSFAWFTELKYHQCVGESSHENIIQERKDVVSLGRNDS